MAWLGAFSILILASSWAGFHRCLFRPSVGDWKKSKTAGKDSGEPLLLKSEDSRVCEERLKRLLLFSLEVGGGHNWTDTVLLFLSYLPPPMKTQKRNFFPWNFIENRVAPLAGDMQSSYVVGGKDENSAGWGLPECGISLNYCVSKGQCYSLLHYDKELLVGCTTSGGKWGDCLVEYFPMKMWGSVHMELWISAVCRAGTECFLSVGRRGEMGWEFS